MPCSPPDSELTSCVLSALQLGDINTPIIDYSGNKTTVSAFLNSYFNYKYSFRWECVIIGAAFIAVFRVGAVLAIKFISFQKR